MLVFQLLFIAVYKSANYAGFRSDGHIYYLNLSLNVQKKLFPYVLSWIQAIFDCGFDITET